MLNEPLSSGPMGIVWGGGGISWGGEGKRGQMWGTMWDWDWGSDGRLRESTSFSRRVGTPRAWNRVTFWDGWYVGYS